MLLEAIFLSTFVVIGQNRQAAFQLAKADHDYHDVDTLPVENIELTRTIHELTEARSCTATSSAAGRDPLRALCA